MAFQIKGQYFENCSCEVVCPCTVFHPASSTLNVAKAGASTINLFGLEISNEGKSAFSGTFSWAA
jgi:hypothetical protein